MSEEEEEREIGPIIEMNDEIIRDNEELARRNTRLLKKHNIRCIEVVGAIGSGKTLILEKIVEQISKTKEVFVICGDVSTTIDADRIQARGGTTYEINTGRECALNAYHIQEVIKAVDFPIEKTDVLFIENVGNLICPSDFILGAEKRVMVVSVTEGDHVIIKHPLLVKMSEIIIINKTDLAQVIGTDLDRMIGDAKAINPDIEVIPMSAKTGKNMDKLMTALNFSE